jgi:CMP/dCMP kinase
MTELLVTIDGPAGSGKSTVGKLLAEKLGACFLDTGAMYRTVTWAAMQAGVDLKDGKALLDILDKSNLEFSPGKEQMLARLNGQDVTEIIRRPDVTANVHYIASNPLLRDRLVAMQRKFAAAQRKIITEGRDQGTVAFPQADVKFYLTAGADERARRRKEQLHGKGINQSIEQVNSDIIRRDNSDLGRQTGPLKPADDAILVDTTGFEIEQSVQKFYDLVKEKCPQKC